MLKLKSPIGTNYRADPNDLVNTKQALNRLGYYDIPPERGVDDWADSAMFDGIKQFQKDNGLKVDAFMRPEGPTEQKMNSQLADGTIPQPTDPGRQDPSGKGFGWPMGKPGPSQSDGILRAQLDAWKRLRDNAKTDSERSAAQLQIDRIEAILRSRKQ